MKKSTIIKIVTGSSIAILLLVLIFMKIDLVDIKNALFALSFYAVILGLISYLATHFFRTLRFRILLHKKISFKELFSIVCFHNLFVSLIPARLGEMSYVYFVNKKGIPLRKNISSILIARMIDLCVVVTLFFIGMLGSGIFINQLKYLFYFSIFIVIVMITFLGVLTFKPMFFIKIFKKRHQEAKSKTAKKIYKKIEHVLLEFKILRKKRILIRIITYSFLIWIVNDISTYFLLNSIFPQITLLNTLLIATAPILFSASPIHTFGGFGTMEAGFLFSLLLFGISVSAAASAGFIVHLVQLLFVIIGAGIGYFILIFIKKKKDIKQLTQYYN